MKMRCTKSLGECGCAGLDFRGPQPKRQNQKIPFEKIGLDAGKNEASPFQRFVAASNEALKMRLDSTAFLFLLSTTFSHTKCLKKTCLLMQTSSQMCEHFLCEDFVSSRHPRWQSRRVAFTSNEACFISLFHSSLLEDGRARGVVLRF